ncbi:Tripartite-type tricarboxylate transporter, receptor component TctC [Variovorax sp. HW608]|uniref:Bug family tripartite tricarboxylate transporter substrate binding protein n=1 Tax=Variovorax sp. HW608 TaxID=1034889 RepID=UPI00081FAF15|nr:tripartite tricarboxylate transporter substrate binding protein [Variovorax sp. HW608]SCK35253.1 Tripartite-type tricarboxylate transporter, receptor component TctC [Variovorax sp. HW608]
MKTKTTGGGPTRRDMLATIVASMTAGAPFAARAQQGTYPNRPIRIIVPWAAGGGGDVLVRAITPSLAQRLGQAVIVDNRPGAIGTIGSQIAAHSLPDGYTLVYGTADSHSIAPHILKTRPYDSKKDFVAIAPIGFTPLTLIVHASSPAKTFEQFLRIARNAKQPPTFGSWGQGSSGHITMEALKQATHVNLLHIPYNGTAPLITAQLAGQVDCAIVPVLVAEQYVQAGTVRMLAVTARERLPSQPNVPIMKELGVDIDMGPWLGFLGPAGLPPDIVQKLSTAITASIAEPQVADAMKKMSMVMDTMSSPAAYQRFCDSEYDRWGKYIRAGKVTLDP